MKGKLKIPSTSYHPAFPLMMMSIMVDGVTITIALSHEEIDAWLKQLQWAKDSYRPWIMRYFEPIDVQTGEWECRECVAQIRSGNQPGQSLIDLMQEHLMDKHRDHISPGEIDYIEWPGEIE